MVCPAQYCCASGSVDQGCPWNSESACEVNRDPSVPLCGDCLPGYSHSISGNACVPDRLCGDHSRVAEYVSLLVLYWLCLCLFFMQQANLQSLIRWLPRFLRPNRTAPNDGSISVLVYYYQLAAIAVPQGSEKLLAASAKWFCLLGQVLGFSGQLPSWSECTGERAEAGGVCFVAGTAAISPMLWSLATPFLIAMLLYPTVAVLTILTGDGVVVVVMVGVGGVGWCRQGRLLCEST